MQEGRLAIDERQHEVYYRIYGDADVTLVCLHGGPGGDHQPLLRLGELADDDLQVLLYDQLGSGRSDRPDDDSLWAVSRFVEELETLRVKLDLGKVVLLGQSWGGMLALQYALDHPEGVAALVLSNTGSSVPEVLRGMMQLRAGLDAPDFATLMRHEGVQDYANPEYLAAVHRLYARHLRRATPFSLDRSLAELAEQVLPLMGDMGPAYNAMWGPHEFLCSGPLLEWDVTDRLGEIEVPCLILCGFYDEVTVPVHQIMAERIRDNEFLIFGNSSHIITLEKESDAYLGVVRNFIARKVHERGAALG